MDHRFDVFIPADGRGTPAVKEFSAEHLPYVVCFEYLCRSSVVGDPLGNFDFRYVGVER